MASARTSKPTRRRPRRWGDDAVLGVLALLGATAPDFVRDVQPILAASCVRCHGPGVRTGLLRLDTRTDLLEGGESGDVVVAGDARRASSTRSSCAPIRRRACRRRRTRWRRPRSRRSAAGSRAGAPWPEGVTVAEARRRALRWPSRAPSRGRATRVVSATTATCGRSSPGAASPATARTRTAARRAAARPRGCGEAALRLRRPWPSSPASPTRARWSPASSTPTRRAGCRSRRREPRLEPATGGRPAPLDRGRGGVGAALGLRLARRGQSPGARDRPGRAAPSTRSSSPARGRGPARPRPRPTGRAAPPPELRPHRPAADAGGGRRVRGGPRAPTPTSGWSTGCWPRRTTASGWPPYWLDLVRYADTRRLPQRQPARPSGCYRDYVIDAFNRNMPFDQFTAEQLAGDLLPDATLEQKIASGYNRLLQTTEEGGAQAKEYTRQVRRRPRAQRLDRAGWARRSAARECHDHKFDPYLDQGLLLARRVLRRREGGGRRAAGSRTCSPDAGRSAPLDALDAKTAGSARPSRARHVGAGMGRGERRTSRRAGRRLDAARARGRDLGAWHATLIQGNDGSIIASTGGRIPRSDTYAVTLQTELAGHHRRCGWKP